MLNSMWSLLFALVCVATPEKGYALPAVLVGLDHIVMWSVERRCQMSGRITAGGTQAGLIPAGTGTHLFGTQQEIGS